MKKLCFVVSLLLFFRTQAQITLTEGNFAEIGDRVIYSARGNQLPPSITPGNSGTAQVWNFSSLTPEQTDTIFFTHPGWTGYDSAFSTADLASQYNSWTQSYDYYLNNSSALYMMGTAGDFYGTGIPCSVIYSPPLKYIAWPAVYGQQYSDSSESFQYNYMGQAPSGPDSVRSHGKTVLTTTINAWGTMQTPLGVFNALRCKKVQFFTDTVWFYNSTTGWDVPSIYSGTSIYYEWWTDDDNIKFPLVTLGIDSMTGNTVFAMWVSEFTINTSVAENTNSQAIWFYPNPANDFFVVETKTNVETIVELYDITGRKLKQINGTSEKIVVNTEELRSGIYICVVKSKEIGILPRTSQIVIAR